jgi:hypothetical protein
MGTSTINIIGSTFNISAPNVTITPNSANVIMSSIFPTANVGSNDLKGMSLSMIAEGAMINGGGIFNNLSITGTTNKNSNISIGSNTTVTGTFTAAGNSTVNRLLVRSNGAAGTVISVNAAAVSLSNVDFKNITGAGAAAPFTGLSLGDAGGNSGITFTAATTRYAVTSSNWSNTSTWSSSSGGVAGASVPLAQDSVIINGSSGNGIINLDMPRLGADIDFTGYTGTVLPSTDIASYGSITAGGAWGISPYTWNLQGRGSHNITCAGKTFGRINIDAAGGTYTLQDNLLAGDLNINAGALITQNKTLNVNIFNLSSSSLASANIGNSIINLKSTGNETIFTNFNALLTAGSPTINVITVTSNSRSFYTTGISLANATINYTIAGSTGSLQLNAPNASIGNLNFADANNARTIIFNSSGPTTFTGTFNVKGTAGKLMNIRSDNTGVAAVLFKASGAVNVDYLSLQDSTATGGAGWYAGANSVNLSNNSGWVFSSPPGHGGFLMLFNN